MKKLLLISAIGLSLTALTAFTQKESSHNIVTENYDCQYGRCSQIKADGYQCRNCSQQGSYYCWSHR